MAGAASWNWVAAAATADDAAAKPAVRLGLLTDIHYADIPAANNRYYRDSLAKVRTAVGQFNEAKLDGLVFLGDLVDTGADVKSEIGFVKTIDAELRNFKGDRHYVLGNHCIWSLTKQEFADATGAKVGSLIRSTRAGSTSWSSTPASARTASPTAARTTTGRTPTYPRTSKSGSRPIWRPPPRRRSSSSTSGSTSKGIMVSSSKRPSGNP